MGFTALDGLVMGRRCGDLDPGVAIYLAEQMGMSVRELLYRQSGLLGVDIDVEANERSESNFHTESSKVSLLKVATDEERVIANAT